MPDNTMQLIADLRKILELAKGLAMDAKRIQALNDQMKLDLEQVAKTWLDDGVVEVHDYVKKVGVALDQRKDSIGQVAQKLVQYADKLSQTK